MPLAVLQDRLSMEGRVNALLTGGPHGDLQKELTQRLTLADWDLAMVPSRRGDYVSLESRRMILEPVVAEAVDRSNLVGQPTFVYLANNIADERRVLTAAVSSIASRLTADRSVRARERST